MDDVFVSQYVDALKRTERYPPAQLAAFQNALIESLVRHAVTTVPFYRLRLAVLFGRDGQIDLSRWREVPILTRAEATSHADAMRAQELSENQYGPVSDFETSGSDGSALRFGVNGSARLAHNAALTRAALWFGADPTLPMAQIRIHRRGEIPAWPDGKSSKGWSFAFPAAEKHDLDLRTPVEQQLEWLARKQSPYLMTSPSNALALAYAASPAQARALGLKLIFSIAETVLPGTRELIAERLGARLVAIYSCEEVGFIATECPFTPHYHVVAENTHVEIVDDAGNPTAPGEIGRVLVTGLYNYATPFIRYEIGDVAVASDWLCACGRSLPVIPQVIGRTRYAFVFRDGTRVWPRVWDARAMRGFVPCREFQVVQVDHERIEFRYVPDNERASPDIDGLTAYARAHLHPSVRVAAIAVDAIPRGPGGKHDPFVSLIGH